MSRSDAEADLQTRSLKNGLAAVVAALMKSGQNMTEALQMMSRLSVELSGKPYRDVIWLST